MGTRSSLLLLIGFPLGLGSFFSMASCLTPKPVCTVINVADAACGAFVSVKLEDGSVVAVPLGDIRNAAKRTQQLQKEQAK